jgi:hypothetical protein
VPQPLYARPLEARPGRIGSHKAQRSEARAGSPVAAVVAGAELHGIIFEE